MEIGSDPETEAAIRAACQGEGAEMVLKIQAAIDQHSEACERPPNAILFHPSNHELIGWDEVCGLPALPDPIVELHRFRILCQDQGGMYEGETIQWDANGVPYSQEIVSTDA